MSIAEIADTAQIPYDYVEKLLLGLKRAGIVKSHRGNAGGYTLVRDPSSLSMAEVFEAVGEGTTPWKASGPPKKGRPAVCPLHPVWRRLSDRLSSLFREVTLNEFIGVVSHAASHK